MEREKILQRLQELLDDHIRGNRGYLGQESYLSDFFELFKEAYRGSYFGTSAEQTLTGDAIRDTLQIRWIEPLKEEMQDNAIKTMNDLLCRWDSWRYAWDNYE